MPISFSQTNNSFTSGVCLKSLLFYTICYGIIIVLIFSGTTKLLDPEPTNETIKAAAGVSEGLQITTATLLSMVELTLGTMLLLKIRVKMTLLAVTFLFLFFFLFSIYGVVIGLENDCGCFGNVVKSEFGISMVTRNLILLIISLIATKISLPGQNQ
jgi:hypothetical protein